MDSSSSQSSPLTSSHSSPQSSPPSSSSYRSRGSPCFYTTPLASSTDVTVYLRPPLRRNYRTSLEPVQECDGDTATAAISEPPGLLRNLKRAASVEDTDFLAKKMHRIESTSKEQEDLEEAAIAAILSPDINTSRHSDLPREDEGSEDDKKFMKEAQEVAMNSPDPQTKVGAVIVDPKTKKIVARGWNRMPNGCEEEFKWYREKDVEPFEHGKHLYVVYGVRAAIIDGLQKGADLRGCILYTTLYPSNVCAQCIRDVGIAEVVYVSDKFRDAKFMVAARRILRSIKCRQMK